MSAMDFLRDWLSLIAVAISVGGAGYAFVTARSKANSTRLDAIDERLSSHAERIHELESEMRHLPDKDTVTELKLAIAELKGTVGRLDENLGGVARTVTRIDEYLLVLRDHQALAYINGVARIPADYRFKGVDGFDRHGDSAIAGALAWFASRADLPTYGYQRASDAEPGPGIRLFDRRSRETMAPTIHGGLD